MSLAHVPNEKIVIKKKVPDVILSEGGETCRHAIKLMLSIVLVLVTNQAGRACSHNPVWEQG